MPSRNDALSHNNAKFFHLSKPDLPSNINLMIFKIISNKSQGTRTMKENYEKEIRKKKKVRTLFILYAHLK